MIESLANYIQKSSREDLLFLLYFYNQICKLQYDPTTMELQYGKLNDFNVDNKIISPEVYLLRLTSHVSEIFYDKQSKLIKMIYKDYNILVDYIHKNLEVINKLINTFPTSTKIDKEYGFNYTNLVKLLKNMYDNAPEGYQMTMLHLFGIQFASELKQFSISELALEATGKTFLHVEIGKGVKLSKFVRVLDSPKI